MIALPMLLLGVAGLNRHDQFTLAIQHSLAVEHHFRDGNRSGPPRRRRARRSPFPISGVPRRLTRQAAITRTIKPVPRSRRIERLLARGSNNLVTHMGPRHAPTHQVPCADLGLNRFPQPHWLGRCVDFHLVLGLLVFLDSEKAVSRRLASLRQDLQVPEPQRRPPRQFMLARHPAKFIGGQLLPQRLVPLRISQHDFERTLRELGDIRLIVTGPLNPGLEVHFL